MRLRSKLILFLVLILITNCFVIIGSAPSSATHPVGHIFFIALGILNLIGIAWLEYLAAFDYRKKM